MNGLNVIDVSACVYTGNSSKWHRDKTSFGLPVGGIHYLMRQICNSFAMDDSVVLCFDSPSFRSELDVNYKANRVHRPEVYMQIELLFKQLESCGFVCEKYDGYEADDIIDWAVQSMHNNYYETVIIGNDHDLLHSVQNNVRFKSIEQGMPCVFVSNFSEMADSTYTRFNTISAKKALCGCVSDEIPSIKLENGMRGKELYDAFLDFFEENNVAYSYANTTNRKLLLIFAAKSGLFTPADFAELKRRIELVYPAACPEDVSIAANKLNSINLDAMIRFITLINDQDSIKFFGGKRATLTDADKQPIMDLARQLKTGVFAADRSLENQPKVETRCLDFDLPEKEF